MERYENNHELRVLFLKNRISESDFKTKIGRNEKIRRHLLARVNVLDLLHTVSAEAYRGFLLAEQPQMLLTTVKEIAKYCLQQSKIINQ